MENVVILPIYREDVSRLSASAPKNRERIISFHGNTNTASDASRKAREEERGGEKVRG